jgi:6-phosphogluconolactonase/glucosamine-6-phosphate isomerase/deaminase
MDKLHDVKGSIEIVLSIPGKTKKEAEEKYIKLSIEEVLRIALLQIRAAELDRFDSDSVH